MKKILVRSIALALVLVLACLGFASCAKKLSGTYKGEINILVASYEVTYEFSGSNVKVTRQVESVLGDSEPVVIEGTYEITEEDEKQYISFDFIDEEEAEDDEAYVLGIIDKVLSGKMPYSEEDGTITIGSGLLASKFTKK